MTVSQLCATIPHARPLPACPDRHPNASRLPRPRPPRLTSHQSPITSRHAHPCTHSGARNPFPLYALLYSSLYTGGGASQTATPNTNSDKPAYPHVAGNCNPFMRLRTLSAQGVGAHTCQPLKFYFKPCAAPPLAPAPPVVLLLPPRQGGKMILVAQKSDLHRETSLLLPVSNCVRADIGSGKPRMPIPFASRSQLDWDRTGKKAWVQRSNSVGVLTLDQPAGRPEYPNRAGKAGQCPNGSAPFLGAAMKPNSSLSCKPARKRHSTGWSPTTMDRSTT